ncbi:MAG: helix-turn-helix transcriptional regulator [Thermoleophilia bacterium]
MGRDRLRELLDAVLGDGNRTLGDMAGDAHSSPHHFTRLVRRDAGEPPVAMRRRVMLERAAWQLRGGASVTDAALAAGYESVEGFARAFQRAFGHPPSATPRAPGAHWLPAPNGIHFHPPESLWVTSEPPPAHGGDVTALLVHHDVDDTRALLAAAAGLDGAAYRLARLPGNRVSAFEAPDESIAAVLRNLVWAKVVWTAAIEGADQPRMPDDDPPALAAAHEDAAARWLAAVRDIGRRGAWGDVLVDALCDPPESFALGAVVADVLSAAVHRRGLARMMLLQAGAAPGDGDVIMWTRRDREDTA